MTDDFDFFSDAFRTDPHAEYARMRAECPVAHASEPYDWWAVTREADVKKLLRKPSLWTSEHGPGLAYAGGGVLVSVCLLYTSPSPRDLSTSRMPSSA